MPEEESPVRQPSMEERWEDPKTHLARFEEMAGMFTKGEFTRQNEDGTRTTFVSYERYIDPLNRRDLGMLKEFRLRAAAAGLTEAFSPLVLSTQSTFNPGKTEAVISNEHPHRAETFVQLGYAKPATSPDPRLAK